MKDVCPKCKRKKKLTRHHILPKRWFVKSSILNICRKCHNELELLIPFCKMPIGFYKRVVRKFMKGGAT